MPRHLLGSQAAVRCLWPVTEWIFASHVIPSELEPTSKLKGTSNDDGIICIYDSSDESETSWRRKVKTEYHDDEERVAIKETEPPEAHGCACRMQQYCSFRQDALRKVCTIGCRNVGLIIIYVADQMPFDALLPS